MRRLAAVLGPLQTSGTEVNTIGPSWAGQTASTPASPRCCQLQPAIGPSTIRLSLQPPLRLFLALLCLAHDVLITTGLFAWLGTAQCLQVDSLFAVALLNGGRYSGPRTPWWSSTDP